LGAQPLDVHVDQPGVGCVAIAPDLLQEDLPGEDLPRLAGQADEQVELERGQVDLRVAPIDGVPGDVDAQVADADPFGTGCIGAADPGPDPGDQLLGLERLDDVV